MWRGSRGILIRVALHVDVVDSTWVGAAPELVAPYVADRSHWGRWWPDLTLELTEDRGVKGIRWAARTTGAAGRMEVWLQPELDGTVAHYFLALEQTSGAGSQPDGRGLAEHYRMRAKSIFWAIGDLLEPARAHRLRAEPAPAERPFVL